MIEPTCALGDAATVIFNLPDYRVIDAIDLPLGGRRVVVQADTIAGGCPDCGVMSDRIHAWCRQRVRDIPHAGGVELVVVKPRLACAEASCARRTFTPATGELPRRARCTTRLRAARLTAVIDQGQPVAQVARNHGVAWWTTQNTVNAAAVVSPDVDDRPVKHLDVDEHRYRRVRWYRDPDTSAWRRLELWMTTVVNAASAEVLGIVDGRDSTAVESWLTARALAWRERVEIVAIDPRPPLRRPSPPACPGRRLPSIRFIWSSSRTCASPGSANAWSSNTNTAGAVRSTPLGHTAPCCCAAATPCRPGPGIRSRRFSPPTIPPANSAPPGV